MKLTDLQKEISGEWKAKGYELPEYDREAVKKNTKENPAWIHFGAGNIFRAFPAEILQRLLNSSAYDKGVIVAESFDHEIITKAYKPYDSLSLSVVLKSNGTIEKKVVGSVVEALVADQSVPEDFPDCLRFLSPHRFRSQVLPLPRRDIVSMMERVIFFLW